MQGESLFHSQAMWLLKEKQFIAVQLSLSTFYFTLIRDESSI